MRKKESVLVLLIYSTRLYNDPVPINATEKCHFFELFCSEMGRGVKMTICAALSC